MQRIQEITESLTIRYSLLCLLTLLMGGCNRSAHYPEAPAGNSEEALLKRSKLHIMYTFNAVPFNERQDFYVSEFTIPPRQGPLVFKSIKGVDKNFDLVVVEKSSTSAVVLSQAKNERLYWFWGPISSDEWVLNNGNWEWVGLSDLSELTRIGAQALD